MSLRGPRPCDPLQLCLGKRRKVHWQEREGHEFL